MKPITSRIFCACAVLLFSATAAADSWNYFFTGEQLFQWGQKWDVQSRQQYVDNTSVQSIKTALDAQKYKFYITGVQQAATDIDCYPPGITTERIYETVYTYLRNHPESRDESAVTLIRRALYEAFGSGDSLE